MPKKEIFMFNTKCETKDGKIAKYSAYRSAGAVVIRGPNSEWHRCHLGVTTAEAARIEIAKVYGVKVLSVSDGRQS